MNNTQIHNDDHYNRRIIVRIIIVVLILTLILTIASPAIMAIQFRERTRDIIQRQKNITQRLAAEMGTWATMGGIDTMIASLRQQKAIGDIIYGRVIECRSHIILADTNDEFLGLTVTSAFLNTFEQHIQTTDYTAVTLHTHQYQEQEINTCMSPICFRRTVPAYILQLGFSREEIALLKRELIYRSVSAIIISLVLTLGLWVTLRRWVMQPLRILTFDVRAITAGLKSRVRTVGSHDEMTILSHSFNSLLEDLDEKHKLEQQVTVMKQESKDRRTYLDQLRYLAFWIAHDLEKQLLKLPDENGHVTHDPHLKRLLNYLGSTCDRLKAVSRETETINASIAQSEKFDLVPLLTDIVDAHSDQNPLITFSLNSHVDKALINGDPYLLHNCFDNLLNNAQDAVNDVERPGKIDVSLSIVELHAFISFTDNGCGMDLENTDLRHRIFMPFFSTKVTSDDERRLNSGMGLHSVNEIIAAHGGIVRVESTPDKGTTFELTLPLHESEYYS